MAPSSKSSSSLWVKSSPSQYPHYEAQSAILHVRSQPFGVMVIDGGGDGGDSSDDTDNNIPPPTEILEFNTKRWWSAPALPQPKQGYAVTPVGDSVLVVGGFYKQRLALDTVHRFTFVGTNTEPGGRNNDNQPSSQQWQSLPPLNIPRSYPAAVSVSLPSAARETDSGYNGDKITNQQDPTIAVILGGRNGSFQELNSVEYYDSRKQSWNSSMPSFNTPRMAPAAIVLPTSSQSSKSIIAKANSTGRISSPAPPSQQEAALAAIYQSIDDAPTPSTSPSSSQEAVLPHCHQHIDTGLTTNISSSTAPSPSTANRIVLLGGYNGSEWVTSIEVLELPASTMDGHDNTDSQQQWSVDTIASMPIPVSYPQAVVIPEKGGKGESGEPVAIVVIGTSILYDMDDDTFTIIQSYSLQSKSWAILLSTPKRKSSRIPNEGCTISFFKNAIYAIGGKESAKKKKTAKEQQKGLTNISPKSRSSKRMLQWKIDSPSTQLQDGCLDLLSHAGTMATTTTNATSATTQQRSIIGNTSPKSPRSANRLTRQQRLGHRRKKLSMSHTSTEGEGTKTTKTHSRSNSRGGTSTDTSDRQNKIGSGGGHPKFNDNKNFMESSERSRGTAPPSVVDFRNTNIDDFDDLESLYSASHVPMNVSNNRSSARPTPNEHELVETKHVRNLHYIDYNGLAGLYTGYVAIASNRPHGKGQLTWTMTGDMYDGEWKLGSRYGYGRMTYAVGDVFEGMFQNDMKVGRGTYQWRDGKQYEGQYRNNRANDTNGTLSWKNGTIYVGSFQNGQRTGKGRIKFPTSPSNVQYNGNFVRGKYDGHGTCIFQDGRIYTGQWKKGQAHGKGKLTDSNGQVIHDGDWANDEPF